MSKMKEEYTDLIYGIDMALRKHFPSYKDIPEDYRDEIVKAMIDAASDKVHELLNKEEDNGI